MTPEEYATACKEIDIERRGARKVAALFGHGPLRITVEEIEKAVPYPPKPTKRREMQIGGYLYRVKSNGELEWQGTDALWYPSTPKASIYRQLVDLLDHPDEEDV